MSSTITSILDIGRSGLFAHQKSIQVVSNNVANANTPGYRRQALRLEEAMSINHAPGQMGTGVTSKEVFRYFDAFIEAQYNDKASEREMWQALHENLGNVEIFFDESRGSGLNDVLADFWGDWQELSKRPEDINVRSVLIGNTYNLTNAINQRDIDLNRIREQMDDFIKQDVEKANSLMAEIAEINRMISIQEVPGVNNLNESRDKRDNAVRELAKLIDIDYIDNGGGNVIINTKAGHTLVDGIHVYDLKFEAHKIFTKVDPLTTASINYEGASSYEITIEVVTGGDVTTATPQFRVSLDGGRTWLKDDAGNDRLFDANEHSGRVTLPVDGIQVWFDTSAGNDLTAGDRFEIVPKSGLYWYENTSSAMNITPQILGGGQMNNRRIIGGSLAGYFHFRDHYVGKYQEKLDATAESLIWEVNRIHSQGAGLNKLVNSTGTYGVTNSAEALGSASAGLHFGDKLQSGNFSIFVYDQSSGAVVEERLDFGAGQNFDPAVHTLQDVRAAVDAIDNISASISNNKLVIEAGPGHEFAFGNDTSGLLAALGLNTFFDGNSAGSIITQDFVRNNISYINAGKVNGAGEANPGDNSAALGIAELQYKRVSISTSYEGETSQSIQDYYNSLLGNIGADTSMSKFNAEYNKTLADELNRRQEEVSGVNLDEEMTNLIRFQHAYQASAKLITTADRMLQTLIAMKT